MINDDELELAHNGLVDTDERYGKRSAYVKMGPYYTKLIKGKTFLRCQWYSGRERCYRVQLYRVHDLCGQPERCDDRLGDPRS